MVTTLLNRPAAREAGYEMTQYIAKRIQADAGGAAVLVSVGVLPAGSIIIGILSRIATVFAGGTPALALGSNATAYNNLNATIAETTLGSEVLLPLGTFVMPLTVDTEIFANLTGAATSGDGYIVIQFVKPLA
jgi:hypothetical protein